MYLSGAFALFLELVTLVQCINDAESFTRCDNKTRWRLVRMNNLVLILDIGKSFMLEGSNFATLRIRYLDLKYK